MNRENLVFAFVGLLLYLVLNYISNQFKWIALGFGGMMLLMGLFGKNHKEETPNEEEPLNEEKTSNEEGSSNEEEAETLIKSEGGNKNDI